LFPRARIANAVCMTQPMLSVAEAQATILALYSKIARPIASEVIPNARALGRRLASNLHATGAIPAHDLSMMDGYAMNVADKKVGAVLEIHGESAAGSLPQVLQPGTCMRIATGAPVPSGATLVLPQENVGVLSAEGRRASRIEIREDTGQGWIRHKGAEYNDGDLCLAAGTFLDASRLGFLAALNLAEVPVARKPRVAILPTGNELKAAGSTLAPGQTPDVNGPMLMALCESMGAHCTVYDPVKDTQAATMQALEACRSSYDLVLTIGGVSVGDHDWVESSLRGLGAEIVFHRIRMKPGKPLLAATVPSGRADPPHVLALGLPGNPNSALVTFLLFAAPVLRALLGDPTPERRFRSAPVMGPIRAGGDREEFLRGKRRSDGSIDVLNNQSSGAVTALAQADTLIRRSPHAPLHQDGALLDVATFAELL
jgi:molybdopterin molybdotransferase